MSSKKNKNYARCFGQDLMKGEHKLRGGMNTKKELGTSYSSQDKLNAIMKGKKRTTWVAGDRDINKLDDTSLKILKSGGQGQEQSGTSIFDPVLCELIYRWFSPPDGLIVDPFAGGSVRGIVASKLGRQYIGIDLRQEQIEANRIQAEAICKDNQPVWHIGNSVHIDKICDNVEADLVFSCPPYVDLEVYSDNPDDLSTMNYNDFKHQYFEIIKKSCSLLKNNRFACFVVGEVRDKKGNYYNFVGDTITAFLDAGLNYYNECILVTAIGSLPIRVGKQFTASRKIGKTHQNILIFVKGDGKKAVESLGGCEFGEIDIEHNE